VRTSFEASQCHVELFSSEAFHSEKENFMFVVKTGWTSFNAKGNMKRNVDHVFMLIHSYADVSIY
jgi:hypothetical protein